ncbi:MAG: RdgB/HAM1 family non-canonical purine NTP pyrophosphatase [Gammaproteobacteria bacterium]|nr:RdgB/HAM1 family non-canonical purine NTP pyrophosphatase [Gammaproteobacteria bacterium]
MQIVLASANEGKIREFKTLLTPLKIDIIPQSQFNIQSAEETGSTFIENAILKARHATEQSQLPALADDSGLIIPALAGRPGIYSARYAGPEANAKDNMSKILQELSFIPDGDRYAYFYCVLVLMLSFDDPAPIVCEGYFEGSILTEPCGTEGFGYDPIFFVPSKNCAAAELAPAEKNKISHRAMALHYLLQRIKTL